MLRSLKKRATTAFRKKKDSTSDLDTQRGVDDQSTPSLSPQHTQSSRETTGHTTTQLNPITNDVPVPVPVLSTRLSSTTTSSPTSHQPGVVPPRSLTTAANTENTPVPDLEPQPTEDEAPPDPEPDPFAPKYVPFIEASPLKNNMFAAQTSVYGRINPDIMGGFGGDDESIWLVDDEETDEEQQTQEDQEMREHHEEQHNDEEDEAAQLDAEMEEKLGQDVPQTSETTAPVGSQSTGTTSGDAARPAFAYRAPVLLDDSEWLSNTPSSPEQTETTETTDTMDTTETTPPKTSLDPRRGYAPLSTAILDVSDFDFAENAPEQSEEPLPPPAPVRTPAATSAVQNPYVALFEQQDMAMTVAYLRQLDQSADVMADDFSFGLRYQQMPETSDVVVTHQRTPRETFAAEMECIVCTDTKPVADFPRFSITAMCTHKPTTCLECVQMSIESDLNNKLWTDIRCPECREMLEYADIQRYANEHTFMRYETLAIRAAMSEAENFFWCTSGCGSGQIHESGTEQPIVTCLHCHHRSCFQHNVAWHETLTCEEYDQLLADPENFRSQVERDNEEWTEAQRAQLEADRNLAQGLLAEEQAELKRREERARQEREQARKAAELVRKIATRRKREEQQSQATVNRTTKPCPGCGWAIEKNDGCSHMTCIKCSYEFCWGCYKTWTRRHSINCRGAKCRFQFCYECGADHRKILRRGNTVHDVDCKFHPRNLPDLDEGQVPVDEDSAPDSE